MLIGTSMLKKVELKAHFKLRQSSEMAQSPEEAVGKVGVLMLSSESHIWDRVTLGTQVGGSSGGDGEGEGDGGAVEAATVGDGSAQPSAQCM